MQRIVYMSARLDAANAKDTIDQAAFIALVLKTETRQQADKASDETRWQDEAPKIALKHFAFPAIVEHGGDDAHDERNPFPAIAAREHEELALSKIEPKALAEKHGSYFDAPLSNPYLPAEEAYKLLMTVDERDTLKPCLCLSLATHPTW